MAKFALFNIPAHGHINPTLPVVAELARRGHTVDYYAEEPFRAAIERAGARLRPYPRRDGRPVELGALVGNLVSVSTHLLGESLRLLPFVLDELRRESPDLVIFDANALWGMQGAILRGIPAVASIGLLVLEGVTGLLRPRDYLYLFRRGLPLMPTILSRRRRLVREYGPAVFPRTSIFPAVAGTNIVFTSRTFQPATPFVDDTFHFVGPSIDPTTRAAEPFPWETLDEERARIFVSLGTLHSANSAFYRTVLAALAGHPAQVILSAGHQTDLHALGPIPENVVVRASVPQLELLDRVDLFVTHGGMNSISEGLYNGVPLVIVPQQLEQVLNGRNVARLGAGLVLGDSPPYGRIDPRSLRTAVDRVLGDATVARNAGAVGRTLQDAGGYRRAADIVEATLR